VIGLGRTRGFVVFLKPSGGVSDPHKTGEAVGGLEERKRNRRGRIIIIGI
jgi:hypothetical protein